MNKDACKGCLFKKLREINDDNEKAQYILENICESYCGNYYLVKKSKKEEKNGTTNNRN